MALSIEKKFEDSELKSGGNFYVPDGWYKVMLTNAAIEDSPFDNNNPKDLVYYGVITAGEYQHQDFEIRLSVNDETTVPNAKNAGYTWAKMAHKNLLQIAQACGFESTPYNDLEKLLKKPLMIEFGHKKGNPILDESGQQVYDEQGNPETYPPKSFPKKFKKIPAAGSQDSAAPRQPVAQPAAPQAPAPAPQPVAQPQQPMPQPMQPVALDDEIPFN